MQPGLAALGQGMDGLDIGVQLGRPDFRILHQPHFILARVGGGDLRFGEDMIKLPVGLRVASITPASVRLKFEPRLTILNLHCAEFISTAPPATFYVKMNHLRRP